MRFGLQHVGTSVVALSCCVLGCSARSSLEIGSGGDSDSGTVTSVTQTTAVAVTSSTTGEPLSLCTIGAVEGCGSNVGACVPGHHTCQNNQMWGECTGTVGPTEETCNGIDDDCDGVIDNGFGIGTACAGTGTDQCLDGLLTCDGCVKSGPDKVEVCNGVDDNCNGIIDADCAMGDCQPALLVTGSTPSSPNCVDFPVMAGSSGTIQYPCGGGPVTADLGGIQFSGSVSNNIVSLSAVVIQTPPQTPDGCTWQLTHHIDGALSSGTVTYSYSEAVISGVNCWQPCTESGVVQINWTAN